MPEFVEIYHEGLDAKSTVVKTAYERVWSKKGWVLVEDGPEETEVNEVEEEEIEEEYVYSDAFDEPEDDDES